MADLVRGPLIRVDGECSWPAGRHWARARRWAAPGTPQVLEAARRAATDWDPKRDALVVARTFSATDDVENELDALASSHRTSPPSVLPRILFDEVSYFAYLRGLPSLMGHHAARALGGAASSCAVLNGWTAAEALAKRMLLLGHAQRVLLVSQTEQGQGLAQMWRGGNPTAPASTVHLAGAGAVTAVGASFDETWSAMLDGRVGVKESDVMVGLNAAPAMASIDPGTMADVATRQSARIGRPLPPMQALTHEVIGQALQGSSAVGPLGLVWAPMDPGPGGSDFEGWVDHFRGRPREVVCDDDLTQLADDLSAVLGEDITSLGVEATCAGGVRALAEAIRMVETGEVPRAVAVAVVARNNPYHLSQFAQLTALSRYPREPSEASRPFAMDRSGMVMAEAAAAVLVTATPSDIIVEGCGFALDANHPTAPNEDALTNSVATALNRAGHEAVDVETINAHGTGTRANDEAEAAVYERFFGARRTQPSIAACKSMTGHASSASGLLEVAVLARTLREGWVPGVPTCAVVDPAFEIDVSVHKRPTTATTGLTTSLGFGGQYAAAVLCTDICRQPAPAPG